MGILATIDSWDKALVDFIQENLRNGILDVFFETITNSKNWIWPFIVIIVWLLWKGGKRGRIAVMLLVPLLLLSSVCTDHLIKPLFARPRPLMKNGWSFPSAHATNAFAIATLLSYFVRTRLFTIIAYTCAGLVAISRLYLGVHYLTDVLAGAALGVIDGIIMVLLYLGFKTAQNRLFPQHGTTENGGKAVSETHLKSED